MADRHWARLSALQPHARRVEGIDGILNGHRRCAALSRTSHFFVVDADNEVLDFGFDVRLPTSDKEYVHLWYARNPLNRLEYGWGGIKLFAKRAVLSRTAMSLDMTMGFPLKIIPEVRSITHFNTSPFNTWRSAFREAVKLAQNEDAESQQRLATWCRVASGPFADWCLKGATFGREWGLANHGESSMLHKINDWQWLSSTFKESA